MYGGDVTGIAGHVRLPGLGRCMGRGYSGIHFVGRPSCVRCGVPVHVPRSHPVKQSSSLWLHDEDVMCLRAGDMLRVYDRGFPQDRGSQGLAHVFYVSPPGVFEVEPEGRKVSGDRGQHRATQECSNAGFGFMSGTVWDT